jgi:putative transcriptional regulator
MNRKLTNQLAECLAAKGVKKSQLAFWLKMSRAYVTRLEHGDIRPSIETALRIASYFKKPVGEIFQLIEEGGKPQIENTPKSNFPSVVGNERGQITTPIKSKKAYANKSSSH